MADLLVGTVVRLKSGGVKMTVSNYGSKRDGIAYVEWVVGGTVQRDTFPVAGLDVVEEDDAVAGPTDAEFRMECLRMADEYDNADSDEALFLADQFFNWVRHGEMPEDGDSGT